MNPLPMGADDENTSTLPAAGLQFPALAEVSASIRKGLCFSCRFEDEFDRGVIPDAAMRVEDWYGLEQMSWEVDQVGLVSSVLCLLLSKNLFQLKQYLDTTHPADEALPADIALLLQVRVPKLVASLTGRV